MERIVNLTPHAITIVSTSGEVEILPEPTPARVSSAPGKQLQSTGCGCDAGCDACGGEFSVPLTAGGAALMAAPTWGEVEGLPEPQEGTIYVVSSLVAARCAGRRDVFSPGTGPNDGCVRDEKGRIVGVTRLIQAPRE